MAGLAMTFAAVAVLCPFFCRADCHEDVASLVQIKAMVNLGRRSDSHGAWRPEGSDMESYSSSRSHRHNGGMQDRDSSRGHSGYGQDIDGRPDSDFLEEQRGSDRDSRRGSSGRRFSRSRHRHRERHRPSLRQERRDEGSDSRERRGASDMESFEAVKQERGSSGRRFARSRHKGPSHSRPHSDGGPNFAQPEPTTDFADMVSGNSRTVAKSMAVSDSSMPATENDSLIAGQMAQDKEYVDRKTAEVNAYQSSVQKEQADYAKYTADQKAFFDNKNAAEVKWFTDRQDGAKAYVENQNTGIKNYLDQEKAAASKMIEAKKGVEIALKAR